MGDGCLICLYPYIIYQARFDMQMGHQGMPSQHWEGKSKTVRSSKLSLTTQQVLRWAWATQDHVLKQNKKIKNNNKTPKQMVSLFLPIQVHGKLWDSCTFLSTYMMHRPSHTLHSNC